MTQEQTKAKERKEALIKEKIQLDEQISKLDKVINAPVIAPHDRFIKCVNGLTRFLIKNQNGVFYFKNGKFVFHEDFKTGILWCNKSLWELFEKEYGFTYDGTQNFIRTMVEETFHTPGLSPKVLTSDRVDEIQRLYKDEFISEFIGEQIKELAEELSKPPQFFQQMARASPSI